MIDSVCYDTIAIQSSSNDNGNSGNNRNNGTMNNGNKTIVHDNNLDDGGIKIAVNLTENIDGDGDGDGDGIIDDIHVDLSQNNSSYNSRSSSHLGNSMSDITFGTGNILCTHDGVLLKKANAEYISDINTSGSLSLVEYTTPTPRRLCIEWRPNENILIADDTQDQEDWALVDTISRRTRTISECNAFNVKPMDTSLSTMKPRLIRVPLDDLATIDVKNKGQNIRFACKTNNSLQLEFFFQHGNADLFIRSMRHLHVIELAPTARNQDKYIILPLTTQKLKKTFAELDIGEIKSSSLGNDNWLSNKVVEFLSNIPDYVAQKTPPKQRPGALDYKDLLKSSTANHDNNYQMVCLQSKANNTSNNQSPASNSSGDLDSYLENVKEVDEKIISCLPERHLPERGQPLNENEWFRCQTIDQRILQPHHILQIIFRGGIENDLRSEVWKYLLNFYQWQESECERIAHRKQKSTEYYTMKAQWLAMTTIQETHFSGYRDRKCQIEKDVKRTDRSLEFFAGENNTNLLTLQGILMTYAMYNFDLGYVQGMSDLLAPILAIMKDEVDAFWCFVGFMDMVVANFDIDQAGMKAQFIQLQRLLEYTNPRLFNYLRQHDSDNMFFCFRWLLVWYKREFDNKDILHLWECLWTGLPCPNFHLLISAAILDNQADIIIEGKLHFNEILKHINELAGNIDLAHTLQVAEGIYEQLKAAENLPNDIRKIVGLPLIMDSQVLSNTVSANEQNDDFLDDSFDALVPELTPEQKELQQQLLEEACERSMFLQYM